MNSILVIKDIVEKIRKGVKTSNSGKPGALSEPWITATYPEGAAAVRIIERVVGAEISAAENLFQLTNKMSPQSVVDMLMKCAAAFDIHPNLDDIPTPKNVLDLLYLIKIRLVNGVACDFDNNGIALNFVWVRRMVGDEITEKAYAMLQEYAFAYIENFNIPDILKVVERCIFDLENPADKYTDLITDLDWILSQLDGGGVISNNRTVLLARENELGLPQGSLTEVSISWLKSYHHNFNFVYQARITRLLLRANGVDNNCVTLWNSNDFRQWCCVIAKNDRRKIIAAVERAIKVAKNEIPLEEDGMVRCRSCGYRSRTGNGCGCFDCRECGEWHNSLVRVCDNCHKCQFRCHCYLCSPCGTYRSVSQRLQCGSCQRCTAHCSCPAPRLYEGPNPPIFHAGDKLDFNPSKRYVSAEIEVSGADIRSRADQRVIAVAQKWGASIVRDGSLPSGGFEINTAPASANKFVEEIEEFCSALKYHNAVAGPEAGLHVHVDATDFDYDDIRKLCLLYYKLEEGLYASIPASRRRSTYCVPCREYYITGMREQYKSPVQLMEKIKENIYGDRNATIREKRRQKYDGSRYRAMNLHSWVFRGTVECRMHPGTVRADKIINWGMLWASILDFAKNKSEEEILGLGGDSHEILIRISPTKENRKWLKSNLREFSPGLLVAKKRSKPRAAPSEPEAQSNEENDEEVSF